MTYFKVAGSFVLHLSAWCHSLDNVSQGNPQAIHSHLVIDELRPFGFKLCRSCAIDWNVTSVSQIPLTAEYPDFKPETDTKHT